MNSKNLNINQLLPLAQKALQYKKFNEAINLFKKIISINKNIPEIHNNLGSAYLNLNNLEEAKKFFNNAIKLKPEFSVAYLNVAIVYEKIGNFKSSEENYKKSIFYDKKNIVAHYNLGNLYKDQGDLINAEKYYKLTIHLKPGMIHAYKNLFFIFNRSNQIKKLEEIISLAKDNLGNHPIVEFFQGVYDYENKNFINVIKNFENIQINKNDIGVSSIRNELLAKSYDNIGNYNKSFECFVGANNYISEIYKDKHKKERYIDLVKKRINYFSKFKLNTWKLDFSEKIEPIFLIGFPRSGTTLLDTILRTHDSVEVIEEKPIVEEFVRSLNVEINNEFLNLENIENNFANQMRSFYFEKRNKFIKFNHRKIYIDKLPLNFIFIAEICRFFPRAKFIFALRNPYDVILSCFMQQFSPNDAMMNFTNLDDASYFYDLSMTLYRKYYKLFKSNIFEIKYEDVVLEFDDSIKKLLNFLNLDFKEEIKKFYETATKRGIISTPSFNQVNKQLYKNSINRWKNYEDKFHNCKPILNKWLNEFNY